MSWSLGSDNHSGVHPTIMKALEAANVEHAHAYGMDEISEKAKQEWDRVLGVPNEVFYVFNGTAANVLSLQSMIKSYQSVICSDVAHLNEDECAAPEKHLGAKLWSVPSKSGKIYPAQLKTFLSRGGDQHYASPRAVSLTVPTEFGASYTLEELRAWHWYADQKQLLIHWDGARLVNMASFLGCTLKDLIEAGGPATISFGGTKNGLMGAEAIIVLSPELAKDFKYLRKQGMQLPSKTRFLAAQFYAFLKDDLYKAIADHVTSEARHLGECLSEFPEITIEHPIQSNAVFVRLPKAWIEPLKKDFFFYIWNNETNLARWMISFDWQREHTDKLLAKLREVKSQWP